MSKKYVDRIRIYLDDESTPMAECHFTDGIVAKICWTNVDKREHILDYVNGYTLFDDERVCRK